MDTFNQSPRDAYDRLHDRLKALAASPEGTAFFAVLVSGMLAHLPYMTRRVELVGDGLLNCMWYVASDWEVSLGRFMWHPIQRLRGFISDPSGVGLLVLLWFALAALLLVRLMQVTSRITAGIMGAFLGMAPQLVMYYSNVYFADALAVSGCAAVFSMWLVFRRPGWCRPWQLVLGAAAVVVSLGVYQANLGAAAVLALFLLYKMLRDGQPLPEVGKKAAQAAGVALAGMVAYYLTLQLLLRRRGIGMASYRGANTVSPASILRGIPAGLRASLSYTVNYFFYDNTVHNSLWHRQVLWLLIFALFGLSQLYWIIRRQLYRQPLRLCLMALCFALQPFALDLVVFLAPGNSASLLMSMPAMFFIPCIPALTMHIPLPKGWLKVGMAALCCCMLWTYYWQDHASYLAIENNINRAATVVQDVYNRACIQDEFRDDLTWVFLGTPNGVYRRGVEAVYGRAAGAYTDIDVFWPDECSRGLEMMVQARLGIRIDTLNCNYLYEEDPELLHGGILEEMPCYPREGCVRIVGDKLVVKFQEPDELRIVGLD